MAIISSLVAHYKMNDNAASATVLDAMGSYDGTYKDSGGNVNTSTGSSSGRINGALDCDGGDEYIDLGDPLESLFQSSFSISIWVKPDDGHPAATVWFLGITTTTEEDCVWMTLGVAGNVTFQYSSDGNMARLYLNAGNALFSDGQEDWHHLVMVADSTINGVGGVKGYFDGDLQSLHPTLSRGDTSAVVFADFASTMNMYLGAESLQGTGPSHFYAGLIDNVMLFSKALSSDEVRRIYNNGQGTEIVSEIDETVRPRRGSSPLGYRGRYEF